MIKNMIIKKIFLILTVTLSQTDFRMNIFKKCLKQLNDKEYDFTFDNNKKYY